jgi:lipopolysaccharide biosynthesis glycosyltransferase
LRVHGTRNLHKALLHKLDVVDFAGLGEFDKILYIDCDIIVQKSLRDILGTRLRGKLYAATEFEGHDHPFFGFEGQDVDFKSVRGDVKSSTFKSKMKSPTFKSKMKSPTFNNGVMLFEPSLVRHFETLREFVRSPCGRALARRYYDQSFFNAYFAPTDLVDVDVLTPALAIFPELFKASALRGKTFVHFAGLGRYAEKIGRMKAYVQKHELL